jgi:hypothetical protein
VVLGTVTSNAAMTDTLGGLTHRGELIVIGVNPEPFQVNPFALIVGGHTMRGHQSGTSRDTEETLRFAALTGVRPMIEEGSPHRSPIGRRADAVGRGPLPHGPDDRPLKQTPQREGAMSTSAVLITGAGAGMGGVIAEPLAAVAGSRRHTTMRSDLVVSSTRYRLG